MIPSASIFFLALLIVAALLRVELAFSILYLFFGVFLLSRWWARRALEHITFERSYHRRAFLGEEVQVELKLVNQSWLPAVWLRLQDALPLEISYSSSFRRVISLPGRGTATVRYRLNARKRGFYPVGPLRLTTGDLFGLSGEYDREESQESLTVYPQILPLLSMRLPARIPLGTMAYERPFFEDPNRPVGKRPYVVGDSLRRVDWKATAVSGELQVKTYEPSIALDVTLFLGFNPEEYFARRRIDAMELAIVAAASLAKWTSDQRQAVGLLTNGGDPEQGDRAPPAVPPRKGRENLIRVLEILARVTPRTGESLVGTLRREALGLSWGATLVVFCGQVTDPLLDELIAVRRRGLQPVLVPVGQVENPSRFRARSRQAGIPFHHLFRQEDLRTWGTQPW